ncbi:MAG: RDD family protein [Bacteroidota bacterium]
MATIIVPTTQQIELEYPVANLGERMAAGFIDLLIIMGYGLIWILMDIDFDDTTLALLFIPIYFYSFVCELLFNGRTVGKLILGLQVIRLDGAPPTVSAYLLRWMLRLVDVWLGSLLLLPGLPGVVTMAVNKKGQRLGDIVAATTVIKLKLVVTFGDTIFRDTKDDYQVKYPSIESLTDRDMRILKEVLDAGLKSKNPMLIGKLSDRVAQVLDVEKPIDSLHFLETVLTDYNHVYGRS